MNAGIAPAQVQQRVQLDGGLGRAKRRPVEQAQAQIDGGGVQRIDTGIEIQHRRLLGIQRPGAGDQPLSQCMVDAPVAQVQRIGQRRASRGRLQIPMWQQLGSDWRPDRPRCPAVRFAPGKLREGPHARETGFGATERANACIALVSRDDAPKRLPRHELHDLRKQRLAHVHASPRVVQNPRASQTNNQKFKSWTPMNRSKTASALASHPAGIKYNRTLLGTVKTSILINDWKQRGIRMCRCLKRESIFSTGGLILFAQSRSSGRP